MILHDAAEFDEVTRLTTSVYTCMVVDFPYEVVTTIWTSDVEDDSTTPRARAIPCDPSTSSIYLVVGSEV